MVQWYNDMKVDFIDELIGFASEKIFSLACKLLAQEILLLPSLIKT